MRVHALRLENAQALGVVGACGGEIVCAAEEVAEGGVDAAVLPLARLFPGYGYEGRAYCGMKSPSGPKVLGISSLAVMDLRSAAA